MSSKSPFLGLGNDIISTARIRKSIEEFGPRFLSKFFTEKEREYCSRFKDPVPHYAGRFAAKEAISKALGTGFGEKLSPLDIEILNTSSGKPEAFFSSKAQDTFSTPQVSLSISHAEEFATAVAIWHA